MIFGLPVHPLVVHLVVVLLPLSVIAMLAAVTIRRLRPALAPLAVIGAIISAAAAYLAVEAGETLAEITGVPSAHANYGKITLYLAIAFAALALIWIVIDRPWRRTHTTGAANTATTATTVTTAEAASTTRTVANISGALAALVGVAALVFAVLAGHTGAQAVWGDIQQQSQGAPAPAAEPAPAPASAPNQTPAATATPAPDATAAGNTAQTPALTAAEVAKHSDNQSCWTIIDNKVYDLTQWINRHPGGERAIEKLCGKDGSGEFRGEHATDNDANQRLNQYLKGELARG